MKRPQTLQKWSILHFGSDIFNTIYIIQCFFCYFYETDALNLNHSQNEISSKKINSEFYHDRAKIKRHQLRLSFES